MCYRRMELTLTIVPLLCGLAAATENALSETCCWNELPTSESTKYLQSESDSTFFGGLFAQTLSGPATYDGSTVEESNGSDTGENTCYFPGDLPGQHPGIFGPGGSSWTVTGSEWGPDFVGMFTLDAQQIWDRYGNGLIELPCNEISYQHMQIFCNGPWYNYDDTLNVVQVRTVNTNDTITVYREDVPSPQIPIPR